MRQQTIINRLVKEWAGEYKDNAAAVIKEVLDRIKSGQDPTKAVAAAYDSSDFAAKNKEVLQEKLYQAAAYGYGINPAALDVTRKAAVIEKLTKLPWSPDNMPLSQRLHGMDTTIKKQVSDAIKTNLQNGTNWAKLSRELYDGYNAGHIIPTADLPAYLSRLKYYAKKTLSMGLQPDIETTYKYNKALQRAERLINSMAADGAPNRALKTAYKDLYDKAQLFSETALDKAAYVAMQERSRYFAERIARTEIARAWTDGFVAKTYDDDLIIAYRWKLGSRHPRTDICDLNAGANMYNLGPGIYPKNSMPRQPAHPHCLCMISAVYEGEIETERDDNIDDGGRKWLEKQPDPVLDDLLGQDGAAEFKRSGDWQDSLRNWQGHDDPIRRLKPDDFEEPIIEKPTNTEPKNDIIKENTTAEIADNIKQIGKYANVDLTGIPADVAAGIEESVAKVFNTFPQLSGEFRGITAERLPSNTYAQCYSYTGRVVVNKINYASVDKIKKSYDSDVKTGFHPKDTDWKSVVTHELGHAVDGYLTRKGIRSEGRTGKTINASTLIRQQSLKNLKLKKTDIAHELSRYATSKDAEFLAEAFCEYLDSPNPRPIAKEVGRLIENYMKELRHNAR